MKQRARKRGKFIAWLPYRILTNPEKSSKAVRNDGPACKKRRRRETHARTDSCSVTTPLKRKKKKEIAPTRKRATGACSPRGYHINCGREQGPSTSRRIPAATASELDEVPPWWAREAGTNPRLRTPGRNHRGPWAPSCSCWLQSFLMTLLFLMAPRSPVWTVVVSPAWVRVAKGRNKKKRSRREMETRSVTSFRAEF